MKNNLVRIIVGVKRADRRVKENIKKQLVSSTRAGRVKRMGDEKPTKRADVHTVEGKLTRGRPKLRCVIALIVTQKEWEKDV